MQELLEERQNPEVPSYFLLKLMKLVLENNIYSFHNSHWKQEVGAAMGSKPVPAYANICMAKFDNFF